MFKTGDEVEQTIIKTVEGEVVRRWGVVSAVDDEGRCFVKWVEENGRQVISCGWYGEKQLTRKTKSVTYADLIELRAQIDYSLDTRNQAQFIELSTKYRELCTKIK